MYLPKFWEATQQNILLVHDFPDLNVSVSEETEKLQTEKKI